MKKTTILMYGRTRAGKSAQIGELAEYVHRTLGKITRLYTIDKGGVDTIQPYIDLGLIEAITQQDSDPWIFLHNAVLGNVRGPDNKWVPGNNDQVGVFAFEGMTAFADALMQSLAEKAASGANIGGSSNISFTINGDGQSLKIGGSNMSHYNIVQTRITDEVWTSQKLPAPYIVWTASVSKDEDLTASGKILGPAVVGKALTHEVPRWFSLSFRIDALPAQGGKLERHILYLGNHLDSSAGNAVGLGNTRIPLDADPLPASIEPASISKALEMIKVSHDQAVKKIKQRLNIK